MHTAVLAIVATMCLLGAGTASAQEAPAQALKSDPAVEQSQQPQPTPQGVRSPEAMPSPTQSTALWQAMQDVWSKPIDVQGNPIAANATTGQTSPAAPTASGCATTDSSLAATPSHSTPCPQAGADPVPGGGANK